MWNGFDWWQEYTTPLEPLLKRLSEEFIDDHDLTARLQRLFKVDSGRAQLSSWCSSMVPRFWMECTLEAAHV